jgi:hypothetical protein
MAYRSAAAMEKEPALPAIDLATALERLGDEAYVLDGGNVRFAVAGGQQGTRSVMLSLVGGMVLSLVVGYVASLVTGSADLSITATVLVLGAGFVRAFRESRRAQQTLVDAEAIRIASLPFRLHGYFAVLAVEPSSTCTIRMRIAFAGDDDPPEELDAELDADKVKREGRVITVTSEEIDCSQDDGPHTNRALYLWESAALAGRLIPLHARHALADVKLTHA